MDEARFDRLARLVGAGTTRRALLAAAAALAPAAVLERTAWSQSRCDPPCDECEQCVNARCRPDRDGKQCRRGRCQNGRCVARETRACTITAGNTVSVVTETQFRGQTLRVLQTAQPFGNQGQTSGQLAVTFGDAPVLRIAAESAGGSVTATLQYGDAYRGIRRARFTNDGSTIRGEIDGRAIVPLPAAADPSRAQFQDGGPPPDVKVDPGLVDAVAAILRQAAQDAANCKPPAQGGLAAERRTAASRRKRSRGKRSRRKGSPGQPLRAEAHPENSLVCLALYIPCETGFVGCIAGTASGCAASVFFAGICIAIGLGLCLVAAERCRRNIRHNAPCCPVACGGDPENLVFGSDPSCCEEDETCLDPRSNTSPCCPPRHGPCGGECCPNGACIGGSCCTPPNGVCGNQCCPSLARCCGGTTCCTGTCIGTTCCPHPNFNCGGFCCQGGNACCNNRCCASGQVCDQTTNACRDADPCPKRCENGQCCPEGKVCCAGQCVDVCVK